MSAAARVILHLEMDAFYASVEQRDNPMIRGQPVIVGSPPTQRGVVAAASYEARKFGVRSAMPSVTAGRLCPAGVFVRPRMDAYRAESRAIMAVVRQLAGEQIQQVSVDEAYVNESWREFAAANPPVPESARIGGNYFAACEHAQGTPMAEEAAAFLAGARAVLRGELPAFKMEYPCHSATEQRWFLARVTPFVSGERHRLVVAHSNITERTRMEAELRFQARLAASLLELPLAAASLEEQPFMQHGQEQAENLTGSKISFIHFVNPDGNTIELVAWSRRTLEHYCHATNYDSHYPVKEAGIWADSLREKKPVMFNDYPSYQHKHGLPEGHAALQRLITVPVLEAGRVVMIAGVGNKDTEYTEQDVRTVQLIADLIWRIVERRPAERKVRDGLAYLGTLIEASPVGIRSFDETGQAQTANEAAARMVGASVGDLLAQNFRKIESWKEAGLLPAAERALAQRKPERLDVHFTSSFGKEAWLAVQFVPFQRGDAWHLLQLMTDVGDRVKAAAQLQLQSAALDAAANAIAITDERGVILWVNAAFTTSTGYSLAEAVGQPTSLLKSGAHPREFYEGMWKTINAGQSWHGELRNRRKDGSLYDEEMTIAPVRDSTGGITNFIAIKQDITARKSLEKQFLRAQRLEGIGLLAGGIAHDLNNVLAPILMGADLLKMQAANKVAERQLESIVQSAKRGADIVKQVLTFARGIEGERVLLHPKHIIKEMVRMARETFPPSLRVQVDVPNDLWPLVGDPTQLHQVLLNLSVNARDAMPDGGELSYGARNTEVDAQLAQANPGAQPGPHVVLRVKDTGTGMTPEVMERIFEPFYTTKELGKGTGLGLSTTLGIVRSHGGFVTVASQVGHGTTFEVYLPASPQAASAAPPVRPDPIPLGEGELVLVVDDEADIVQVTRSMLECHGYRVLTASDGTIALTELSQHLGEVRLVITDIMMPFMDGVQLIRAAHRLSPGLKVIASSGALGMPGQKDRTDEVRALGVKHILHKPYSVETLLRTVHEELYPVAEKT